MKVVIKTIKGTDISFEEEAAQSMLIEVEGVIYEVSLKEFCSLIKVFNALYGEKR